MTQTFMSSEASEAGAASERFLRANQERLIKLGAFLRANQPPVIVTCARGSSDHAATYGKYLFETFTGIPVSSNAMSITSIYKTQAVSSGLCVCISQSGRSPDLLAAVSEQKRAGSHVVALVNDETSPLADLADTLLPLCAGPERSVAATKSYIVSLVGLAAIVAHWKRDEELLTGLSSLAELLPKAFALDWSAALPVLGGAHNLFTIGRGYGFGIAQEAALKLKETCGLHAEAYSAAEVRHGPMAIVGPGFPVIGFATSEPAGDSVRAAIAEFSARGADTFLVDPAASDLPALVAHAAIEPILMIQSFYRFANELALTRNLDPDSPPHLAKVTQTL